MLYIAFAQWHGKTAEKLYEKSRLFKRVGRPTVPEKWPAQRFDVQATERRSPIQVLTQHEAAWVG